MQVAANPNPNPNPNPNQVAALEAAGGAAAMLAAKAGGAASALEVALKVLTREVGLVEAVAAESASRGNAASGGPHWRQAPALAPGTGGPHTGSHSHLQSRVRLGGLDDSLSERSE